MDQRDPSLDELQRLIEAFRDYPGLEGLARRRRCVQTVGETLGVPIDPQAASADVAAVVRTCRSLWGGIQALLETLVTFEDQPHTGPFAALCAQVEELLPESTLEHDQRAELCKRIRRLPPVRPERLRRMYRIAAPSAARSGWDATTPLDVLWELDELPPQPDGTPPLLILVDLLRHETRCPDLERWVGELVALLGLPEELWQRRRSEAETRLEAPPFLVACVGGDTGDNAFWLSVYLQWQQGDLDRLHYDEAPRAIDEMSGTLYSLLVECVELRDKRLVIEFVLPRTMLCLPVDEWAIGEPPRLLGRSYPVVVRERDRSHSDPAVHLHWKDKSAWVAERGSEPDDDAVYWQPDLHGETLRTELVARVGRVCLVLPEPPLGEQPNAFARLGYGMSAGVPAIVWCRRQHPNSRISQHLVERLRGTAVQRHPWLVLDLRLESDRAEAHPEHVGRDLSLLWDPFDRQPPAEMTMTNPSAMGG